MDEGAAGSGRGGRRKKAVGGRRVGEGVREEGTQVGCTGGRFTGDASG